MLAAPPISRPLLRLFLAYCEFYYPRHIHRLLVLGEQHLPPEGSFLLYLNHPSWFDPLTLLLLGSRLMPQRLHYGPIDARALQQYGFFRKLGFFPIELGTLRGARDFLSYSRTILASPDACLWVTAQGRFVDTRQRPIALAPGIEHLHTPAIPLALEYAFLEESKPVCIARFGAPLSPPHSLADLESALTQEMDTLAYDVTHRQLASYRTLLSKPAGVGGIYDLYRRSRAALTGKRFIADHGAAIAAERNDSH